MSLDQVSLVVVVLGAAAGALQGARPHLLRLGAVAGGWLGARFAGPWVAAALHGRVPAFAAEPIGSVIAFVACALLARIVLGGLASMLFGEEREKGGVDRGLGALLGAAQTAFVLWILISALAAWGKPVHFGKVTLDPTRSDLASLARAHSAFSLVKRAPSVAL